MNCCSTKITWKKIFALLVAFIGFTQSFAVFAIGIVSILSNAFLYRIGPDDRICLMIVNTLDLSGHWKFFLDFCEYCYSTNTIPTTLAALLTLVLHGSLCYGLIKKNPQFINPWIIAGVLGIIALIFSQGYVSNLYTCTVWSDNDVAVAVGDQISGISSPTL